MYELTFVNLETLAPHLATLLQPARARTTVFA